MLFLALAMFHAMDRRDTTFLHNNAFLAAIYTDRRYPVFLKYSQKAVALAHLAAL